MTLTSEDLIVRARHLVTVDADNRVLSDHALVIKDGKIHDILPAADATERYPEIRSLDRTDHIVMPGLVNTHCHLAMNLLRGIADDLPLMTWLQEHIWPVEGRWVDADFVADGTALAIAESLLGGVTQVNDMYFFPDEAARVAHESGIRATVGLIALDFPTVWASSPAEYISKGLSVHDQCKSYPRVSTAFAPHAPYTVSADPLVQINTLAAELDIPVHMHVHETAGEVEHYESQHQRRPIGALADLGLLSSSLLAVHMTQMSDAEVKQVVSQGVHILHCPESNMKLASGACPTAALLAAGANVCLGTDGAASNNDLDMFGEMRSASMLAKVTTGDAAALSATEVLRMATINGATALGTAHRSGSLEIGKDADCIALACNSVNMAPMYNPISHLVFSADRTNVTDVWVQGQQLVDGRQLTTLDETKIVQRANDWAKRISEATAQADAQADAEN